jgi:phosphonate transport system substrate-binding protein
MENIKTLSKNAIISILLGFLLISFTLSACVPDTISPTSTPPITPEPYLTPTQTATLRPTATATQSPPGSKGNPISIGFILKPEDIEANAAAEDVAFLIAEDTGLQVESALYPDFQSLSAAIVNGDLDLFWLKPLEYVYLNWEGEAQVVLLTNHLGVYAYGVQFMANVNRGFTSYFDPETNASFGEPITALQQFSGTRPCFIEPDSLPGYLVPLGLLTNTSTPILDPIFTYDYEATVRALYIQEICDFGVSYALIGDPRTSSSILQDIPEAQNDVIIVWQSDGIIPNINLSASRDLPLDILHRLQEAFLDLPNTAEGLNLLSTALNYKVEALKSVEDTFYNPLRAAIVPLELDLQQLTMDDANNENPQ